MKRLLSLILAFFFALNNNVSFQASDNTVYAPDSYYRIEGNEAPDYRYMYENYTNIQSTGKCIGTSLDVSKNVQRVVLTNGQVQKYWFDHDEENTVDESTLGSLGDTYTFSSRSYIVAPQDCRLATKGSDGGGHSMLLETTDGKYKIYVQGMERWFCCRNRTTPDGVEPMEYTWVHTANTYGMRIYQGQMLGVATEGTTVTVVNSDNTATTLTDFYTK